MSIITMLYLADVVDKLNAVSLLVGSMAILHTLISALQSSTDNRPISRNCKITLVVSILCGLMFTLAPNKQTVYAMAAASYAQELAANPKVTEIGDKVYKLLNQKLDEALGEKK